MFKGIGGEQVKAPRIDDRPRGGTWTRTAKLHKAVHYKCAQCGRLDTLETDHIVPIHQGGSDSWTNLQSLCHECHALKTSNERSK